MQQHQQQQQEQVHFDLLAVFKEESSADAAETKLHKEGFGDDEVFRLAAGTVGRGEFREHGPNRERSEVFLQTKRMGPSPQIVALFAACFGVMFGILAFGIVDFDLKSISPVSATLVGVIIGIVLGIVVGMTRKGRLRGAIGQDQVQGKKQPTALSGPTATPVNPSSMVNVAAMTAIALRLHDVENISRRSKARAILINNGGKLDRSVGKS